MMMKTTTTAAAMAETTTAAAMTVTATCFSSNSQSPPNLQNRRDCSSCFCVTLLFCYRTILWRRRRRQRRPRICFCVFRKKAIIHFVYLLNVSCASYFTLCTCSRAPHFLSVGFAYTRMLRISLTLIGACVRVHVFAYTHMCMRALCCSNSNGSAFSTSLAYAYSHPYNSLVAIAIQIKDDTQRQYSIPFHSIRFVSIRIAYRSVSALVYACAVVRYYVCAFFKIQDSFCSFPPLDRSLPLSLSLSLCVCARTALRLCCISFGRK